MNVKRGFHVCVLGGIGAGKSTFTRTIARVWDDCTGLYEPASKTNPYLANFYEDGTLNAFPMQVYLLNRRFEQQLYAQDMALAGHNVVQDSSIFSDSCFVSALGAAGTMRKVDCDTYFDLATNMFRFCMYPSAVVYLDTDPQVQMGRIAKRMSENAGRKCECTIDAEYLWRLRTEYMRLLTGLGRFTHVLKWDWNETRTQDELDEKARRLYALLKDLRTETPIDCFLGVQ